MTLLLLVVAFFIEGFPIVRRMKKALAVDEYLPVSAHHITAGCSLHTAAAQVFHSAHSFITISAMGPIRSYLFTLLFIFCLASQGAAAWLGEGRLCPIALCHPRAPPGPNNGRQECDDSTL